MSSFTEIIFKFEIFYEKSYKVKKYRVSKENLSKIEYLSFRIANLSYLRVEMSLNLRFGVLNEITENMPQNVTQYSTCAPKFYKYWPFFTEN